MSESPLAPHCPVCGKATCIEGRFWPPICPEHKRPDPAEFPGELLDELAAKGPKAPDDDYYTEEELAELDRKFSALEEYIKEARELYKENFGEKNSTD